MDWVTQHNDSLTLQDLKEGNHALIFQCQQCGSKTRLDLGELIARHGAATRVAFIKRNAICPNCV